MVECDGLQEGLECVGARHIFVVVVDNYISVYFFSFPITDGLTVCRRKLELLAFCGGRRLVNYELGYARETVARQWRKLIPGTSTNKFFEFIIGERVKPEEKGCFDYFNDR